MKIGNSEEGWVLFCHVSDTWDEKSVIWRGIFQII